MQSMKTAALAALLASATTALAQNEISAVPGTVNYVEGQVTVNGQPVSKTQIGKLHMGTGGTITTGNGKAEVLLTPGVFVRLDSNSELKMVRPDLTHTEVDLQGGRADVEVDQIYKQNDLLVDEAGQQARLLQNGLYAFDASKESLAVFSGKAAVTPDEGGKSQTVKSGHELALNNSAKPAHFNKKSAEDSLYDFSSLRSNYLGEANTQTAPQYAGAAGFAPGWFWNQGLYGYTWLPGDGAFLSPFGYGFYSPLAFYGGGYGLGGYGYGGYGYGGYGNGVRRPVLGKPVFNHPGVYTGPVGRIGGTGALGGGAVSGLRGGSAGIGASRGISAPAGGGFHGGSIGASAGAAHSGGGGHR